MVVMIYSDSSFLQDGSSPPSWICGALLGRAAKSIWWSYIVMQNLVVIDTVALIVWKFEYFARLA